MAKRIGKFDWGLFFLRVGIGFTYTLIHGYPKLMGGVPKWEKLGGAMSHVGITWMPVFWGFMAMFSEFFGGIFLLLGILVRPAAALILITMGMAIATNISGGNSYKDMAEIFVACGGLLCLLILGSGNISIKGLFKK